MGQYYVVIVGQFPLAGSFGTSNSRGVIRGYILPDGVPVSEGSRWGHGAKLTEHSSYGSAVVLSVESLICPGGMFYLFQLVWSGDYADPEPNIPLGDERLVESDTARTETSAKLSGTESARKAYNLYSIVSLEEEQVYVSKKRGMPHNSRRLCPKPRDEHYRYLLNHTKQLFVDTSVKGNKPEHTYNDCRLHPLPLLLVEGNGRGGGDYHGNDMLLCGTWARDVISVDDRICQEYSDYVELKCNFWD